MKQWNNRPEAGNSNEKALLLKITGRVQGVFFRAETKDRADSLGLTGWVRNCPDSSVEILAQGEEQALRELEEWAGHGPPGAEVRHIERKEQETSEWRGFEIR